MKRLHLAAATLFCAAGLSTSVYGQALAGMTTVTASNIVIAGHPATGFVMFTPVAGPNSAVATGQPIAVMSGGTLYAPQTFSSPISNGVIPAGFTVPDIALAVAAIQNTTVQYKVTVTDTASNSSFTLQAVTGVAGTSFALDKYAPTQMAVVTTTVIATGSTVPTTCKAPSIFYTTATPSVGYACVGTTYSLLTGAGTSTMFASAAPWVSGQAYTSGQVVTNAGSTFAAPTAGIPASTTAPTATTPGNWIVIAAAGAQGTPGTNGTNGINGAAATVTVGSVQTGAAGSAAVVTNSGTSGAAVLNFTVPQGAPGTNASVALKTNGTANGVQTGLNLVSGNEVSVTEDGSGNVTVASALPSFPNDSDVLSAYMFNVGPSIPDLSGNGNTANWSATSGQAPTLDTTMAVPWTVFNSTQTIILPAAACAGAKGVELILDNATPGNIDSVGAILSSDAGNGTGIQMVMSAGGFGGAPELYTSGNVKQEAPLDRLIGPSVLGYALGDGTATTTSNLAYINGRPAQGYKWQSVSSQYPTFFSTLTAGQYCYVGSYKTGQNPGFAGKIGGIVFRKTSPTAARMASDAAKFRKTLFEPNGLRMTDYTRNTSPTIVAAADSIFEAPGLAKSNSFIGSIMYYVQQYLGTDFDIYSGATGGKDIGDFSSHYTAWYHNIFASHKSNLNTGLLAAGTNGIDGGATGSAEIANETTFCNAVHADGGKCVVGTVLTRNTTTTAKATQQQAYNSALIAQKVNASGIADAVFDGTVTPILGGFTVGQGANASPDTAYDTNCTTDGTHLTAGCNAQYAALVAWGLWQTNRIGQPLTIPILDNYRYLNASSTSMTVSLLKLYAKQRVERAQIRVDTAFTGTAGAVSCSVGNTSDTSTATSTYLPATTVTGVTAPYTSAPFASTVQVPDGGTVTLTCTSTNGNLSALTAGALAVNLTLVQTQ